MSNDTRFMDAIHAIEHVLNEYTREEALCVLATIQHKLLREAVNNFECSGWRSNEQI